MALIGTEGFDWSATIADLVTYGKWLDRSGFNLGNTAIKLRFGSGSGNYLVGSSRSDFLRKLLPATLSEGVIGFAYRVDVSGSGTPYKGNLLILWDTTSTVQMGILLNHDLTMSIFRNTHSNILGTTTFALTPDNWYYIELKFKINDSIGGSDVILYVDDDAKLTLAAASDTQHSSNAFITHFSFSGNTPTITSPGVSNQYYDDIYWASGTSPFGNVRVQTRMPSASGNSSQFVGSDGNSVNNFQQIDETSVVSIADYNDGVSVNDKDTYLFPDLEITTNVVYGVVTNIIGIRTDTDAREIKDVIRHGGTDYDGSAIALGASYTTHQTVHETNPDTASGWTKTEVDNAEFGVKVSA